ncbi:Zn2-C6 fungal-type domain-containing protein [Fusarium acuminatum]|uniref:Zn2-C6 fungal-type domain-containing protein n=1 Tax=Fusarium acuminatum TaxID=5515 RepID=A0ABZ2WT27_9HYPO
MSSPISHQTDHLSELSPSSTNVSTDPEPSKQRSSKRVLSCILCQQRKKKCDRKTPCSNCIRLKTVCTPSLPAPPRKRRRPNQDLLERLARCEELLRHCTCIRLPTPEDVPPDRCEQSPSSSHDDEESKRETSLVSSPTNAGG